MGLAVGIGFMDTQYPKGGLKMKKVLLVLLIGIMVTSVAFAENVNPARRVRSTVVTADDGDVTTQGPDGVAFDETRDVLLGFTVFGGEGVLAGIYDTTTVDAASSSNIIAEAETTNGVRNVEHYGFPYPKVITNGITVIFNDSELSGASDYGVVLYFERDRAQYQ